MSGPIPVVYDASLVERAVLAVVADRPPGVARRFHADRDHAYRIHAQEARERAFADHAAHWFVTLGLHGWIERALDEHPPGDGVARCRVLPAASARAELADLGAEPDGRVVVIRLRPESFRDPAALVARLRGELTHVADMLDPAFGYDPAPPAVDGPPARRDAVVARYRAAWDLSVAVRLAQRGLDGSGALARARDAFARAFPSLDEGDLADVERRVAERPTHAGLLALATSASVPSRATQ